MALLGRAAILNWFNVEPQHHAAVDEWHRVEHIPQRLSVHGFLRARRYTAERAERSHLIFYEIDAFSTLTGPEYISQLGDPTPWTRRSVLFVRDSQRALSHVAHTVGSGVAGSMLTLRFAADLEQSHPTYERFMNVILPALIRLPGVTGAHLLLTDRDASTSVTGDRTGRDPLVIPGFTLLLEGISGDACEAAYAEVSADELLQAFRMVGQLTQGIYRLELAVSRE